MESQNIKAMRKCARRYPGDGAVLAVDFGTVTGWAIRYASGHLDCGQKTFEKSGQGGHRFLKFRAWLAEIKNCAGGFDAVFYERVDFVKAPGQARTIFGFEATLGAWCEHHRIPYSGLPVGTIKKFWTGLGRADKARMVATARKMGFDLCPRDHNAADALAVLHLGLERMERTAE